MTINPPLTPQAEIDALKRAIRAMFEDMRLRIDTDACHGHKARDGSYVYPMGVRVLGKLMELSDGGDT